MLRALVYLRSMSARLMLAGILPSCCIANSAAMPKYGHTASAPYASSVHRWCTWREARTDCQLDVQQPLVMMFTAIHGAQVLQPSRICGCCSTWQS